MILFIAKWLLYAAALMLVSHLVSGITIASYGSAVLAAVVIALLDLVLGSILKLLTLPLTIITLGLFLIVINALLFWAAGSMLSGFHVAGFWTAVLGAILYSLLCMAVDALLRRAA
ncbi:phage holin family protein [Brachymonas chironomi]|uniref:phage holin family protein n=1 Tax=Brachymonas chironomi TaxID=491919 RepID=UPI0003799849